MTTATPTPDLLDMTVELISAYTSHNAVLPENLTELIYNVYQALANIDKTPDPAEKLQPVVPIKKSVFPDYIICLEDGKKLKMLKRHLMTSYNMTPQEYRERWNLPPDYPMVAESYAKRRSQLAREIGLGSSPKKRSPARKVPAQ